MNKQNPKSVFISIILFLICYTASSQQKMGIFDGHGDRGNNVKPGMATFITGTGQ